MRDPVRVEGFVIDLDAIVEAERKPDGSVVLLYVGGHTSTFSSPKADELWEVLQRFSRTSQAVMANVSAGNAELILGQDVF